MATILLTATAPFRRYVHRHSYVIMRWSFALAAYCILCMGAFLTWPSWSAMLILWLGGAAGFLIGLRPRPVARLFGYDEQTLAMAFAWFALYCVAALAVLLLARPFALLVFWAGASGGLLSGSMLSLHHDFQRGITLDGPRWSRILAFVLFVLFALCGPLYAMIIFTGPPPAP